MQENEDGKLEDGNEYTTGIDVCRQSTTDSRFKRYNSTELTNLSRKTKENGLGNKYSQCKHNGDIYCKKKYTIQFEGNLKTSKNILLSWNQTKTRRKNNNR